MLDKEEKMGIQRIRPIIVATIDKSSVIGNAGIIPWRIPEDLKKFREITIDHPVIMGRVTYETLPRPLDRRMSIVLTRNRKWRPDLLVNEKAIAVHSYEEAIRYASTNCNVKTRLDGLNIRDCFIIGGGSIYEQFIKKCWYLLITEINAKFEGDTFFPEIPFDNFRRAKSTRIKVEDEKLHNKVIHTIYQNKETYGIE